MMEAALARKLIINCRLRTESPLLIASGQDDGLTDILILKDKQGRPFIPGTALAGVLRSEIAGIYGEAAADSLFGRIDSDDGSQSLLCVSDVVLQSKGIVVRDGVAIDELTGVGKAGAKFDYEALERGAEGMVLLELSVRKAFLSKRIPGFSYQHNLFATKGDCWGELAAALADLLTSGIRLGAMTSKGYGKVAAAEPARVHDFDFDQRTAAANWLQYLEKGRLPEAFYVASGKAVKSAADFYLAVDCQLQGGLLVRDMDVSEEQKADNIAAVQLKSCDDYVIPGTSWKGVLRHQAYKILLALTHNDVAKVEELQNACFGYARDGAGDVRSSGKKSRLLVEETYINKTVLFPKKHSRNRIDRFTGSTVDAALFTDEPVWQQDKGQAPIKLRACMKNCTEAEAGLMLLLLKDLWLGSINIGSGKGSGRGVLRGCHCEISYQGKDYILDAKAGFSLQGSKDVLEGYVKKLVGELNG